MTARRLAEFEANLQAVLLSQPGAESACACRTRSELKQQREREWNRAAAMVEAAATRHFQRSVQQAARAVREVEWTPHPALAEPQAEAFAERHFDADAWHEDLQESLMPPLMATFASGAASELSLAERWRKQPTTAEELAARLGIPRPSDFAIGRMPQWLIDEARRAAADAFKQLYWTKIPQTTRDDIQRTLRDGIERGWSVRRIAQEISTRHSASYSLRRGRLVARTEVPHMLNAGHVAGIKRVEEETGVPMSAEWLSVLGSTTRPTHAAADGQVRNAEGMFEVGGHLAPWPGHHGLPAEERCNCQCSVVSVPSLDALEPEPEAVQDAAAEPPELSSLSDTGRHLGGSTGARLMQTSDGRLYVVKRGANIDRMSEEHLAESLYRALGVNVPESWLVRDGAELVKISKFVESAKELPTEMSAALLQKLRKGFGADALLANWDVAGLDMDNIVLSRGAPVRIDVGGSLSFRAQGAAKREAFGGNVLELWTMADKDINPSSATIFGGMSVIDKRDAVAAVLKKEKAMWKAFDEWAVAHQSLGVDKSAVRAVLEQRVKSLREFHTTVTAFERDKWSVGYVDRLARHEMQMAQSGVFDAMPTKLTVSGKPSYNLYDEKGKLFDSLRGQDSSVSKLGAYIDSHGGLYDFVEGWADSQAGSSWAANSQQLKIMIALQRSVDLDEYYWRHGFSDLLSKWNNLPSDRKESLLDTFSAYHAYNYRILKTVSLPSSDLKKGTISLLRTESKDVLRLNNLAEGELGSVKRGVAESFSLVRSVVVAGNEAVYQELPHTRVLAIYANERTPGRGDTLFYSDRENEIVAMAEGADCGYVGSVGSGERVLSPRQWKKKVKKR